MDYDLLWKAVIIVVGATFLLRFAGRKSISQMTLIQTVIMIGIGSLLIQPLAGENIWVTLVVGLVLILTLIVMEYLQVKLDPVEGLITGKAKVIIENGVINEKNLKKLRLTVDQLEMNLRKNSISRVEDVQWATLEPNGQVAYVLKQDAQPVTKKEFKQLVNMVEKILQEQSKKPHIQEEIAGLNSQSLPPEQQEDLFAEVYRRSHKNTPSKHLQ